MVGIYVCVCQCKRVDGDVCVLNTHLDDHRERMPVLLSWHDYWCERHTERAKENRGIERERDRGRERGRERERADQNFISNQTDTFYPLRLLMF